MHGLPTVTPAFCHKINNTLSKQKGKKTTTYIYMETAIPRKLKFDQLAGTLDPSTHAHAL